MSEPKLLWKPSEFFIKNSNLTQYQNWLSRELGLSFSNYESLWQWSVSQPALFWQSIMNYFKVRCHEQPVELMSDAPMPYTKWFTGATLNYAEHIFRQKTNTRPAIYFASERTRLTSVSWEELENKTASLQQFFQHIGVKQGDRIAAYLPNIPQASIAMLATVAIGAVWSSCSPDFGTESVLDRFKQIEPKVLIAVDGYCYNGKPHNRLDIVKEISAQLPSVEKLILIPYLNSGIEDVSIDKAILWDDIMSLYHGELSFTPIPFSHPIWILYSSGTTGIPKAITHSHGGMLLEHLKYLSFHNDVHVGENFFWYSTTGWMMWNFVHAALLVGASIVLYDGAASYPDMTALWNLTAQIPIQHFGTSAPFIMACMKAGLKPGQQFNLTALRSIGSTGSPLPPEGFDYVYENIKQEVWLCSMSGGTDICTAWVGGNPWLPVIEGEIQCRCLGCAMYAFNENGEAVTNEVGEMVVTQSMPCMPVYFWTDSDFIRYKESYFEMYEDIWRHGDWIKIGEDGMVVIYGRSDTTLNRQGIRIGTAEIYNTLDKIKQVKDSLIVNLELPGGGDYMPLFVVMQQGEELTEDLKTQIKNQLRKEYSPRHVPDAILQVGDIPYTISGKKMEAPVKRILMGMAMGKAANIGAMRNPESLEIFEKLKNEFK